MSEYKEGEDVQEKLVERVLDQMVEKVELSSGVVRYHIPEKIFLGIDEVEAGGKKFDIHNVLESRYPEIDTPSAHTEIMRRSLEDFISNHGTPRWSQIVTSSIIAYNETETHPQTLFISKTK